MSTQKPTVDELVTQVRNLSGLRTNQQCTDIEIASYLTDAGKELADLLIDKNQHYFTKPFDFTLQNDTTGAANGTNVVTLPADFQRADAVDCTDQPSAPYPVTMLPSWLERNSSVGPGAIVPGSGRRYTIQGGNGQTQVLRMLPAFQAQGSYRLWYTPEYPALLTAPASVSGASGSVTATFRAPSIDPADHVLAAVNGTNTWTFAAGGFTQSDVGAEMSPVGTPHSDGVYTVLQVLSPTVCVTTSQLAADTFTTGTNVVIASTTVPALWNIPAAAFDSSYVGGFIVVSGFSGIDAQLDNRTHRISAVLSSTRIMTVGTGVTSNSTAGTSLLPYPSLSRSDLPALLCPWSLFLVVHSSIAVRTKRQQDTSDLQAKLQQQAQRVSKVTANKTSEVVQAPMTRRNGRFGYGYGGGNGW